MVCDLRCLDSYFAIQTVVENCRGPAPAGQRGTLRMNGVGERKTDRHTYTDVEQKRQLFFFIFRIAQFLQNECYLPLKSPHITSDIGLCFRQYFFPPVFPLSIHLERFRLQGLYLNIPYIIFLPQWPNILTLTKTMFHKSQVQCKFFGQ